MGTNKGGRPASYSREQVRSALEFYCARAGRVPTNLSQIPVDEILPILVERFKVSATVRPESLQAVIDDLFAEFVERQRADDRARLPSRQIARVRLLSEALEAALVETLTEENDALARAQFDTQRRVDAEKDALKQEIDIAKRELAEKISVENALKAELDRAAALNTAHLGEISDLRLAMAKLQGRLETFEKLRPGLAP